MSHKINKLQFEVTCNTEAEAFDMRHQFSQQLQEQVKEVMDKVCTQYVAEDEVIQIDRLEIDLKNFDLISFEEIFTKRIKESIETALKRKVDSKISNKEATSKQRTEFQLLTYFVKNGILPWWADERETDMNQVCLHIIEQQAVMIYNFLVENKREEKIWQRIALQFNEKVHQQILTLFPELLFSKTNISLIEKMNVTQATEKSIHKFMLQYAPIFFQYFHDPVILNSLIEYSIEVFISHENKTIASDSVEKELSLRLALAKANLESKVRGKELNELDLNEQQEIHEKEQDKIDQTTAKEELKLPEKYWVYNAGIILLTPFLKQLFTKLDFLENKEWKNNYTQYKAIHLLHYLASGELMCPEYSLVLEKLMCGMEISASIPREIELSEHEIKEADEVLQSVIHHWDKLKNTSIEGLRETFLKREGMLTKKETDWLLNIERKTVDVLLESIPWGYAHFKPVWNTYLIFTEW